eukprot:gene13948-21333_t
MANRHVTPETAMNKAKELIQSDQKLLAMQTLRECIIRAKHNPWNEQHEQAIMKLVDISLDMRVSLRDDLNTYRLFTRDVQTGTLAKVLTYVLDKAEALSSEAEAKKQEELLLMEQGNMQESPESDVLTYVCGEELKERIGREAATTYGLKYITDCYKTCMDIAGKTLEHEDTFHRLACKAFGFCKRHNQKIPFRTSFCRLLRDHWKMVSNLSPEVLSNRKNEVKQQEAESGKQDSKFNLMIKANLELLNVAVFFDNYQEAYKAIEDISTRFTYFGLSPKPDLLVMYYSSLAQVFRVSKNYLFHASALQKLYVKRKELLSDLRKRDREEAQAQIHKLANQCVVAVLCVPFWEQQETNSLTPFTPDPMREKQLKMTKVMSSTIGRPPTRESLLADLQTYKILQDAGKEFETLYNIMERSVQPLTLGENVTPIFEHLEGCDFGCYTQPLMMVSAVSIVVACSKLAVLSRDNGDLESLLVAVSRSPSAHVSLCIDHQTSSVKFEDQNISADILTSTLPNVRSRLASVNRMLVARSEEGEGLKKRIVERQELLLKRVKLGLDKERLAIKKRSELIKHKKECDEQEKQKQKQEMENREEAEKRRQLDEEKKKNEEEKLLRKQAEEAEKVKQKSEEQTQVVIKALKNNQIKTGALEKRLKQGENLDADELMEHGKRLMIEAKYKAEKKRLDEWHKVHWMERACRELEAPTIREAYSKRLESMKESYEKRKENTAQQMRKDWEEAFSNKSRLERMVPFMDKFFHRVIETRMKDPSMIKRAEKYINDEDLEKELMDKVRGTGGSSGS